MTYLRKPQLFIFPHAGGSGISYLSMEKLLSLSFDISTVCYPGRGRRYSENFVKDMDELVEDSLSMLIPKFNGSKLFFLGHSFGALVAFECIRKLQQRKIQLPDRAFFSGRSAPSHISQNIPKHTLDDTQLINYLKSMGGIPNSLINHPVFLSFYLRIIRHDLTLNETYQYKQAPILNIPFVIINGTEDKGIKPGSLEAWQQETTIECQFENMQGGHFFNLENQSFANLICSYNDQYSYNNTAV